MARIRATRDRKRAWSEVLGVMTDVATRLCEVGQQHSVAVDWEHAVSILFGLVLAADRINQLDMIYPALVRCSRRPPFGEDCLEQRTGTLYGTHSS